ncbi:U2 small nuclear ribonucleoprotein, auxiliary factor, small subunit, putative [Perkinsus marinus ATCC 50983]|uniref:U2 small nuclear ribonucleoprotein, auxiliary factor, small subunit, putative n=1 Tax=Perkinsus marinus (strain ATCC 50983 / TXsc) TaxID=423536 RepID=C5LTI5_PERM5|nr:U2 small nuclear ribonucleoprotein, auxiliary factor, small subunit, putative [Perkinsus marinus ATCC 50983]EEQ99976.1 U2 small nuclear ribonucleoprotein, auxiliary factor, small subunit, putative [Perkinsus marinus ATCC 50983]|eukprot:XP_002767259.1 U2 small nuclear ribonucleoprotein, auxiliary factor, small subunit, putative [Perkinsus marinus ATCC 50983]
MAEHLARIFGTEEDRVNCPFYFKIGTCRHGDQCSRQHNRPVSSQTVLLKGMYQNPPAAIALAEGQDVADEQADAAQEHFEAFYEEVFLELANYGTFYAGRIIQPEYSPVTDFSEARCRQFDDAQCSRGGFCNFIHWKHVPRKLRRRLYRKMYELHPEYRSRSRSRSRERRRSRSRDRGHRSHHHHHDDRDRRDRGRDDRGRDRGRERQTSEERRAMIDQWNREAEAQGGIDQAQL